MRRAWSRVGLVVLLATVVVAPQVALGSGTSRGEGAGQVGQLMGRVGLRVDPTGSVVGVVRLPSRILVDASLEMISVVCTNCGTACPPFPRTVQVVLQATAPIAAGYGVSDVASTNYTVTGVTQSTSAALAVGDQVTVTITGNVISCTSLFTVWFSVCDAAPASYLDACGRTETLLHSFSGGAADGAYPFYQTLAVSADETTLYGMTSQGGSADSGVIFSVNTDGSNFQLLHSFVGGASDGSLPRGGLLLSGSTLYGMTETGGSSNLGTIFSIGTSGGGFTLLHSFTGGAADGAGPRGGLILVGSNLYGMTYSGGSSSLGVVFSIPTSGGAITLRHQFASGASDGASPIGSLIASGTTLYGMTSFGGTLDGGTIFSMGASGIGFTVLHEFPGFPDEGNPTGDLVLNGTTLYGMVSTGGLDGFGVVFSMATNGGSYTLMHEFASSPADGDSPYGSLYLWGSTLYGMTYGGGSGIVGTVFSVPQAGGTLHLLHSFTGMPGDGSGPQGGVVPIGSSVYGMTHSGGTDDMGVIFRLD